MHQKINSIKQKYNEIKEELENNPNIFKDQDRYKKISKQFNELNSIVEIYNKIEKNENNIKENDEFIELEKDKELKELAYEENKELKEKQIKLNEDLKILLLPKDPNDDKSIIMEIRAGTGGDEASLFAMDLFRMYSRYGDTKGWKIEIMSMSESALKGIKEVVFSLTGDSVYADMKFESGVHRVQRVPETENSGRLHTSACTVAVLPEAEETEIIINDKDLKIDVYRSSGPGGQSVNTTDSAVRITHLDTGLVVTCQDEKSQLKNKEKALKILKARLYDKKEQERQQERSADRRNQVGSGDRSERIRTYNFPQNRVSDHRINLTLYKLDFIIEGALDELIEALKIDHKEKLLNIDE